MTRLLDAAPPAARVPPAGAGGGGYCNVSQAAALLGVSRVSVWRWIRAGRLPAARLGHRTVRIDRADVERLLAQSGAAGAPPQAGRPPAPGARLQNGGGGGAPDPDRYDFGALGEPEHLVQFYEGDAYHLDTVAAFLGAALRAGDAAIAVATAAHRAELARRLRASGVDLAAARAAGRYVALDAAQTLARILVGGAPDATRFGAVFGELLTAAAAGGRRVRVFGEMVALIVDAGDYAAALRIEALWNDLQQSHAFALLCGYSMAHLGGEAFAAVLGEVFAAHARVIPAESYTALAGQDRRRLVIELQQKARWLQAEVEARRRAEAQLLEALAAERAAREAAEASRAAAEAALRLRDEFLSIAAHELKTPITSLAGHAQLALRRLEREGQLEPERAAAALRVIAGQSRRLSRLLVQLLDTSRLDAGKLALERERTDLAELVRQVVDGARAGRDRHQIAVRTPGALEARVDPLRLEQVLVNLLDNAVKYSPDGGPVEVVLSGPEPVEDGGAGAVLTVRDRGLGIPPEHRERLFERFYQAHAGGYHSGWGLGLALSRQIVELHGGTIRAEFPPDGGTLLVVRLPLDASGPDGAATC
jgi:excisionase family DNA binding protein